VPGSLTDYGFKTTTDLKKRKHEIEEILKEPISISLYKFYTNRLKFINKLLSEREGRI